MKALCKAVENRQPFFVKLPGSNYLYSPSYKPSIYIPGDIVLFAPASTELDCVFLGQIVDMALVGERNKRQRHYDVQCIKRPDGRHKGSMVNDMGKVKIFAAAILCELKPHPK